MDTSDPCKNGAIMDLPTSQDTTSGYGNKRVGSVNDQNSENVNANDKSNAQMSVTLQPQIDVRSSEEGVQMVDNSIQSVPSPSLGQSNGSMPVTNAETSTDTPNQATNRQVQSGNSRYREPLSAADLEGVVPYRKGRRGKRGRKKKASVCEGEKDANSCAKNNDETNAGDGDYRSGDGTNVVTGLNAMQVDGMNGMIGESSGQIQRQLGEQDLRASLGTNSGRDVTSNPNANANINKGKGARRSTSANNRTKTGQNQGVGGKRGSGSNSRSEGNQFKKKRKSQQNTSEQAIVCPMAPRNTSQFLMDVHMETISDPSTATATSDTEDFLQPRQRTSSESIAGGMPYGFEDALYGDLTYKDKDYLVNRLKNAEAEAEDLRQTLHRLRSSESKNKDTIGRLQEELSAYRAEAKTSGTSNTLPMAD